MATLAGGKEDWLSDSDPWRPQEMGWLAGTMKDGEVDWLASRSAWSFPSPRQQSQPSGKGNTGSPAPAEVGHQPASGPDEQAQLSSQLDGNNPGAALCFYFNKPYHLPSPCGLPECFPRDPMKRPISTSNTNTHLQQQFFTIHSSLCHDQQSNQWHLFTSLLSIPLNQNLVRTFLL